MKCLHHIGSLWIKWRLRRADLFPVDIKQAVQQGGSTLVFLPEDPDLVPAALAACDQLAEWYSPLHVLWMSVGETTPSFSDTDFSVVAMTIPKGYTLWGLPYRPLARHVRKLSPRIAVDLNPDFRLASAYLCVESGARLRIGFRAKPGYFNLQYNWQNSRKVGVSEHYGRFMRVLADLRRTPITD